MPAKSLQSCPTFCDPVDCISPGSSVHGLLLAQFLEWVAVPYSGIFQTQGLNSLLSPALAGGFFTAGSTWEAQHCV